MRNIFPVLAMLVLLGTSDYAQEAPPVKTEAVRTTTERVAIDKRIPKNSSVYIIPADGFETYLAAALRKKNVPLFIVTDRAIADFEITYTHEKKGAGWAKILVLGDARSTASASISVTNLKTSVVVFADSSHRGSAWRGERSTAEKLAKYLKKYMEKNP